MTHRCHPQLPVPLLVRQNVPDLGHGLLYLPVGVDLEDEEEKMMKR